MISREDFVFTIGFEKDAAIVDSKARSKYGHMDSMALAREGLFRAAFASTLYSKDDKEFRAFAEYYNSVAASNYSKPEDFMRLFGVKEENIKKVLSL